MTKFICKLPRWIRVALAQWLIIQATELLPAETEEERAMLSALEEQRDYQRYVGYTCLCGERPLPFRTWRSEKSTFFLRPMRVQSITRSRKAAGR